MAPGISSIVAYAGVRAFSCKDKRFSFFNEALEIITYEKETTKYLNISLVVKVVIIPLEKVIFYMFLAYLPPCIEEIVTIATRNNTNHFIAQLIDRSIV